MTYGDAMKAEHEAVMKRMAADLAHDLYGASSGTETPETPPKVTRWRKVRRWASERARRLRVAWAVMVRGDCGCPEPSDWD